MVWYGKDDDWFPENPPRERVRDIQGERISYSQTHRIPSAGVLAEVAYKAYNESWNQGRPYMAYADLPDKVKLAWISCADAVVCKVT